MKAETHYGCIQNATIIEDNNWEDYTDDDKNQIARILAEKIHAGLTTGGIPISEVLYLFHPTEVKYSETCEQCGDCVCSSYYDL